jgi:putative component of membrane protein insertase Oxa1/YidC/SpoIIIJ protein YidD
MGKKIYLVKRKIEMKNRLVCQVILIYQRYLSSRKGFCCAYRQLYEKSTCSNYGLFVFQRYPFLLACQLTRRRLHNCHVAYKNSLSQVRPEEEKKNSEINRECLSHSLKVVGCCSSFGGG